MRKLLFFKPEFLNMVDYYHASKGQKCITLAQYLENNACQITKTLTRGMNAIETYQTIYIFLSPPTKFKQCLNIEVGNHEQMNRQSM